MSDNDEVLIDNDLFIPHALLPNERIRIAQEFGQLIAEKLLMLLDEQTSKPRTITETVEEIRNECYGLIPVLGNAYDPD
jgi:hypothetical protein